VENGKRPGRLPVNVREALEAICAYGKGRCWHCDARLPAAERAMDEGWDVQRINEHPVASIILVCPACLRQEAVLRSGRAQLPSGEVTGGRHGHSQAHGGSVRPVLSFQPKRA
jgi:hypothetical protein